MGTERRGRPSCTRGGSDLTEGHVATFAAVAAAVKRDIWAVARQLHNVTIYVARGDFERVSAFYRAAFGSDPIWQEPGHITCFGGSDMALCVHEEEADHPAGTHELFFWAEDLDQAESELRAASSEARRAVSAAGEEALRAVDPFGDAVRIHRRRP